MKGLLALGMIPSHAIYTYVSIDITWNQYIRKRLAKKSDHMLFWEYVVRTGCVFVTFILAVLVPNLDLFISLVGALALSTLGVLFPAILETLFKWNRTSGRRKTFMICKNFFICIIGLAGFIIGTTLSLKDIIKTYTD